VNITRAHPVSPVLQKVRQLLRGKGRVGTAASTTVIRLYAWTTSIQAVPEIELLLPPTRPGSGSIDAIAHIAESLIEGGKELERQLLSKSLQETLYYCIGFSSDLTGLKAGKKLKQFMARQSAAWVVQQFLSLYFFNFVWHHISDEVRAAAPSSSAFEEDLQDTEQLCRDVVEALSESVDLTRRPLDLASVKKLVRNIETRLRGEP